MAKEMTRCDNLSCICEVAATDTTCSDYCRSPEGRDAMEIRCDCGHDVCMKAVEAQLHGGGGAESP